MANLIAQIKKQFERDAIQVLTGMSLASTQRTLRPDELQLQGILRAMLSLSKPL